MQLFHTCLGERRERGGDSDEGISSSKLLDHMVEASDFRVLSVVHSLQLLDNTIEASDLYVLFDAMWTGLVLATPFAAFREITSSTPLFG